MSGRRIVLDDAEVELEEATLWYEAQRPGLGREFRAAPGILAQPTARRGPANFMF
jgi:hypothetical protein